MYKKFFLKSVFISILLSILFSCDNNSNEIGSDIVGNDNFETGTPETYNVKAINQNTGLVETLDLAVNALGIYKNPVFGTIKANLAVQLQLNTLNPTFDTTLDPQIESVILEIPYFIDSKTTNSDESSDYTLDSIYGPTNSKIKLRVYESGYYIRDIDPVTQSVQRYYNDQNQAFDNVKGIQLNNSADLSQNDQFVFSAAEIVEPGIITPEDQTPKPIRSSPRMKLNLNVAFFQSKIIGVGAPGGKLLNNNVFKEYFRGLYFQVEDTGSDEGNLAMLNIKAGKITIKYNQKKSSTDPTREEKSLILNLDGKSVGFFENGTPQYTVNNDRLYMKGGEGSMAIIDLFDGPDTNNNGFSDKLDELRANKWLVNDASLTFYIDNNAMGNSAYEPNRIYLYDLKNKRPIVDYYADQNSPSSKPKYAKSVFGGIIKKSEINVVGSDKRGTYYKFKITNHIRGLINNADSTNVRLGLVVTENIADISNRKLKTTTSQNNISEIPTASILNPLGTILYGSGDNVSIDKRIQLKIYYTKPKQN
jgi:hypothetical protein